MKYKKIGILGCGLFFLLFVGFAGATNSDTKKDVDNFSPSLFLPQPNYVFPQVVEGTEILHDFVVLNKGKSTLKIKKIKPG